VTSSPSRRLASVSTLLPLAVVQHDRIAGLDDCPGELDLFGRLLRCRGRGAAGSTVPAADPAVPTVSAGLAGDGLGGRLLFVSSEGAEPGIVCPVRVAVVAAPGATGP